jgi:hypothetical protein
MEKNKFLLMKSYTYKCFSHKVQQQIAFGTVIEAHRAREGF